MVLLADFLALIHGLAIITLVVAPLAFVTIQRRMPWLENIFLPVVGVIGLSFLITGECFLTTWEQRLRVRFAPETAYATGFVSHYLNRAGIQWRDDMTLPSAIVLAAIGLGPVLYWRWLDRMQRQP